MTVFNFVFAFLLMLGVLITVHEFGHFIVAKLCGVRVLKFSIGFGPAIGFGRYRLRWSYGGTEYCIAWIPLGGFVKMVGEYPGEEEDPEIVADPESALTAKPVWQKLAVVFAGPAMNLVLPIVVFAVTLGLGMDRPAPVVGAVEQASPAAAAGLVPGDRILSVAGEPVRWWDDVVEQIREAPGRSLTLEVEHEGSTRDVILVAEDRSGLDLFRRNTRIGWLGLRHRRQRALLGIPDASSPAALDGLRSGDLVTAVNGAPVEDWTSFVHAYAEAAAPATLTLERGPVGKVERHVVAVPALGDVSKLGVIPAIVLISEVNPDSPAAHAGLATGDLIVAVDGRPVGSFASFAETVRSSEGRSFELAVARDGATRVVRIAPALMELDAGAGPEEIYMVGIGAEDATLPGAVVVDREVNPFVAVPRAVAMTADVTGLMLRGVAMMVTGDISRKQIGGPIEIAKQAHTAMEVGWDRYINLLILISINLAILNLLPIPVLDGGQAMLFIMEAIKRGPLSLRTREIAMQIGVTLVVFLMGFAFWNDVSRNWGNFVEWLQGALGA